MWNITNNYHIKFEQEWIKRKFCVTSKIGFIQQKGKIAAKVKCNQTCQSRNNFSRMMPSGNHAKFSLKLE